MNNTFFVAVIEREISKTGKYFPNPCWNRAESRYDGSQCLQALRQPVVLHMARVALGKEGICLYSPFSS